MTRILNHVGICTIFPDFSGRNAGNHPVIVPVKRGTAGFYGLFRLPNGQALPLQIEKAMAFTDELQTAFMENQVAKFLPACRGVIQPPGIPDSVQIAQCE